MNMPSSERVARKWVLGSPKVEIQPPGYPNGPTYYRVRLKPTRNYSGSINFGMSLTLSEVVEAFEAVKKVLEDSGSRSYEIELWPRSYAVSGRALEAKKPVLAAPLNAIKKMPLYVTLYEAHVTEQLGDMPTLGEIEAAVIRVRARTTHILQLARGAGLLITKRSIPYFTISRGKPSLVQTLLTARSQDPFLLWVKELRHLPGYLENRDIEGYFEGVRKKTEARRLEQEEERVRQEEKRVKQEEERARLDNDDNSEFRVENGRLRQPILDRALAAIGITELKYVGEEKPRWRSWSLTRWMATGNSTEEDLERALKELKELWRPYGMSVKRKSPNQFEVLTWEKPRPGEQGHSE